MSIGHDGEGERNDFSDFSLRATKRQASIAPVRCVLIPSEKPYDRSANTRNRQSGTTSRTDQTVDYAIQLLLEEAHMLGWQRVES